MGPDVVSDSPNSRSAGIWHSVPPRGRTSRTGTPRAHLEPPKYADPMNADAAPNPSMQPADPSIRIPDARYPERLDGARQVLQQRGFAAMLVGVGPDLRYLAGFVGEPMERLTLLVIPCQGPISFVVPRLEASKAAATQLVRGGAAEVIPFEETDDAARVIADLLAGPVLAAGDAAWERICV